MVWGVKAGSRILAEFLDEVIIVYHHLLTTKDSNKTPTLVSKNGGGGAVEKTRTSTGFTPTATSTLRVYQFRHDRTIPHKL
jgi:hypothetical protein